ncbi:hypothetical protein OP10G_1767 [Fimbriimonas ginsengisoli Gsoil 348]|uniref:Uncharacterized protein n=2 Tax=Fimbriimonas ginsengisoli TaxID=1005039 RepID=A0A068NQX2_FIMGI|nr:hypothetical protein OP10G_1767 [Fimbriimonas ginsengisoli Gsoil 348]
MTGDSRNGRPQTQTTGGGADTQNPGSTDQVQGPVKILIPSDAGGSSAKVDIPKAGNQGGGNAGDHKLKWTHDVYFDAGAQDLIGTFTTQILRYGVRYEQHELLVYARNETLDTRGTNLPFQSIISGFSMGAAYRYWFPGNRMFATVSEGQYLSGPNKGRSDFRVGAAGYWDWRTSGKPQDTFTDIYADAFYIDIAKDLFVTGRLRSGLVLTRNSSGYGVGYGVTQFFASGKGLNGSENRIEGGFGVGYVYENKVSLNLEMRAGYAFRGLINNRAYLNPMIVLSGGF